MDHGDSSAFTHLLSCEYERKVICEYVSVKSTCTFCIIQDIKIIKFFKNRNSSNINQLRNEYNTMLFVNKEQAVENCYPRANFEGVC